jgi:hypothetical protein
MGEQVRQRFPRKAEIERAVAAAKACGIDVAGFEVSPGYIRIVEARGATPQAANDFDRWKDSL